MWFELKQKIVLEVTGRDAERYLNARFTNDIKKLSVGSAKRAAALQPQGRIEAIGTIFRKSAEHFLVVVDGGDPAIVIPAIKRYLVADRVSVSDLTDKYRVLHLTFDLLALLGIDAVELDRSGAIQVGDLAAVLVPRVSLPSADVVVTSDKCADIFKTLNLASPELTPDQQTLERILSGVPKFPDDFRDSMILSEIKVDNLVSFTKGCYVGQEVIERVDSHGKAPRSLVRLSFPIGSNVTKGGTLLGVVGDGDVPESAGEILNSAIDTLQNRVVSFASIKGRFLAQGAKITLEGVPGLSF